MKESYSIVKQKNAEIIKNFKDKESKYEISKVLDLYEKSLKTKKKVVTEFYNPIFLSNITEIFEKIFSVYNLVNDGGYDFAERRCVVFNADFDDEKDYIAVLKIYTNAKFNKPLEHRAVLGSILGLGIERTVIGDIILEGHDCYVFVKKDMSDYILFNLEYVGRSKVKIEKSDYEVKKVNDTGEIKTITISSMRCDVIVANITKYSRNEVKKLFDKDLVFINWKVCKNMSCTINKGDIITVRKFGRIVVDGTRGISKKGKIILDYHKS